MAPVGRVANINLDLSVIGLFIFSSSLARALGHFSAVLSLYNEIIVIIPAAAAALLQRLAQ